MVEEPPRILEAFRHIVKRWREDDEGRQIHSKEEWKKRQGKGATSDADEPAKVNVAVGASESKQPQDGAAKSDVAASASDAAPKSTSAGTISLAAEKKKSDASLRYATLRALQLPPQAWLRIAIFNTGITHIYIKEDGAVVIRTLGDTGHLRKEQITYH